MHKPFAILLPVFLQVLHAQPNFLDSLRHVLTTPPGVQLEFEIHQIMQGDAWSANGTIEIISADKYLAEIGDQQIKVEGTFVQTWNKASSQLIKDTLYQGNVNIVSLLNQHADNLKILNQHSAKGEIKISFSVPDMDATGSIQMHKTTFHPQKVILFNGPEAKTEMNVFKVNRISKPSKFDSFAPIVKDVIDLRE